MEESILPRILLNYKQDECGGTGRQKTKRKKISSVENTRGHKRRKKKKNELYQYCVFPV
jgi:hypothetical protein